MNLLQHVVIHIIRNVEKNMKERVGNQIHGNVMYVIRSKKTY